MTPVPPAVDRYGARTAPDSLRLVQSLANTISVGSEPDQLADLPSAAAWVREVQPILEGMPGIADTETDLSASALKTLVELRSAVRAALSRAEPTDTGGASARGGARFDVAIELRATEHGVTAVPGGNVVERLAGAIVIALWEAQLAGQARQLKLCRNPRCQVAFYDASRNQSGAWHSGARCGNASRVQAYRALKASS